MQYTIQKKRNKIIVTLHIIFFLLFSSTSARSAEQLIESEHKINSDLHTINVNIDCGGAKKKEAKAGRQAKENK
jgi:hypothetical protein